MAAAFELSKCRSHARPCEVTVYQMGHRLGGKGASGRGAFGRIEEHGLHLWMGYYENAFRIMRECYEELRRDPERSPISSWSDAFTPANFNAVTDWTPTGRWLPWRIQFPASPGLPGDGAPQRFSVPEYLARLASLITTLLRTIQIDRPQAAVARSELFPELPDEGGVTGELLVGTAARLLRYGATVGLGALIEAVQLLERSLRTPFLPQNPLAGLVDSIASALRHLLEAMVRHDDEVRRLWEVIDIVLATIRGSIRFRLALDPRGFDAIDDYDSREWLKLNGASDASINSAFMRGLYDLAFAYEQGDPARPSIAAGAALRGAMRAFFSYRGAFFWKMNAGMGDIVFAPLYELLERRGVRFQFFHKLTNVGLGGAADARHVARLEFDLQAHVAGGAEYRPLIDVQGLPCWPAQPDFSQLTDGERVRAEGWDLESQWDERRVGVKTLLVGEDFDLVVLAVGVGVIPHVCGEILAEDMRWREMVKRVRSVPTQAFQLWMRADMKRLGWKDGPVNLSGFVEPFDTWADMTHVAQREAWPEAPRAIAYFCNVAPDKGAPELAESGEEPAWQAAAEFVARSGEEVRRSAVQFLDGDVRHIWPGAHTTAGRFDWSALQGPSAPGDSEDSFATQFWTANVRPSDRYTQALPGSARFRISPLDRTYDNLTIAGDWTSCGLNTGCVEAATMSGLLASHAITQYPKLSDIFGYDHP
jgi:uncharacterized protein with NAD-binding domain and iron-sulfur cluster